jgi:hypothetical protein
MSEDEIRKPNPDFSFSEMNIEDSPIPLEFPGDPKVAEIIAAVPNHKTNKRKWWQGKPKDENSVRAPKERKATPNVSPTGLKKAVTDLYIGAGLALMPVQPMISKSLIENAERCADAWVEYSKVNPAVKRFLIGLCSASAAGTLIFCHLPILVAVMMSVPAVQKKQGAMFAEMVEKFAQTAAASEGSDEQ